jgi:6-pyruvoyltetrahydropterin/6-carboxytetrahydropterin synthase
VAEIAKRWTFSAAHHLPNHFGKCQGEHGHNYSVEVVLGGSIRRQDDGDSADGMVFDYYHMDETWREIEHQLDHKNLNVALPELQQLTTAENIACWIFDAFKSRYEQHTDWDDIELFTVRVCETDKTYAEVTESDWEEYTEWLLENSPESPSISPIVIP